MSNPKTLDSPLSGAQRKYLRGLAHELEPVVQIGKNGVTKAVLDQIDQELERHELIKIRFLDFKDDKKELVETIEGKTSSANVGLVGHVAIHYRQNKDPKKRKIRLPQPARVKG